ncbi:hypothetical protein V9K67_01175 [Paraflavisolibacter sp. H34]
MVQAIQGQVKVWPEIALYQYQKNQGGQYKEDPDEYFHPYRKQSPPVSIAGMQQRF